MTIWAIFVCFHSLGYCQPMDPPHYDASGFETMQVFRSHRACEREMHMFHQPKPAPGQSGPATVSFACASRGIRAWHVVAPSHASSMCSQPPYGDPSGYAAYLRTMAPGVLPGAVFPRACLAKLEHDEQRRKLLNIMGISNQQIRHDSVGELAMKEEKEILRMGRELSADSK